MIAMKYDPKISVLIPARNCESYVAEAIISILNQTFQNWEMLIADDGSTDNTRHIIDQYNDPRILRFHNDTHLGIVHTRNKLLQYAQGDFITWLDADDISYNTRLEKLLQAFEKQPDLALCGSNTIRHYKFFGDHAISNYPLTHDEIINVIKKNQHVPFTGASVAFRREILNDVTGFRPFFNIGGEDPDFILRVSENFRVGNIPDILYIYRYTRRSTSRHINEDMFLKLYIPQIVFFLAEQRSRHSGIDGLMPQGDKDGFNHFIETLQQEFERDRSIIYRRTCRTKMLNQDYALGVVDALWSIKTNPMVADNYLLFLRLFGSILKTIYRVLKRKLLQI